MKAQNPIRWLHLSDFHVGKDGYGQRQLFKYLLTHITGAKKPHFVLITGDISQSGKSEQYDCFVEDFLNPLSEILGPGTKIICVPGNHDVDRSKAPFISRQTIRAKAPDFFDVDKHGLVKRQELLPRLAAFREMDQLYLDHDDWLAREDGAFHLLSEINGYTVGILGVNTAWLSEGEQEKETLTPGKSIVEAGLELIGKADARIVLGHHPIDWFDPTDAQRISALFGRHKVLYLHGHMHRNTGRTIYGAGHAFINVQSGAAFQARESEQWINGFCWGEYCPSSQTLELEPFRWNASNQEWVHDMDAFPYTYRIDDTTKFAIRLGEVKEPPPKVSRKFEPPAGWDLITFDSLQTTEREQSEEVLLKYFDGRIPTFGIALSASVPRREIIENIRARLEVDHSSNRSSLCMILGAGGEGKSTALLQTIEAVLKSAPGAISVLWRKGDGATLTRKLINELPMGSSRWLIASDDADLIGEDAYRIAQSLESEGRTDVSFLFAARHTDWRNLSVTPAQWERLPSYVQFELSGLSRTDAQLVVQAWAAFGDKGLGKLSGCEPADAAERLVEESRRGKSTQDGAFFGALLRLRMGEDLRMHVKRLLDRLHDRRIFSQSKTTLLDAFAYIAAMHAENRLFLSKVVLADVLGVEQKQLRSKVLWPLGEEAAADVAGDFVFTRHRAIAETAVDILKNTLHYEIELSDVYADMVKASRHLYKSGVFVHGLAEWKFLSEFFFSEKDDQALGIKLARSVIEVDSTDSHGRVKLAQLFRRAGQPEQALQVFRDSPMTELRGFFNEWATAEICEGNFALGAYLAAAALSDEVARQPPDNKTIRICLSVFGKACKLLQENYNEIEFAKGFGAAGRLGLLTPGRHTEDERIFRGYAQLAEGLHINLVSSSDYTRYIRSATVAAFEQREAELPAWVVPGDELKFHALAQVLGIEKRVN